MKWQISGWPGLTALSITAIICLAYVVMFFMVPNEDKGVAFVGGINGTSSAALSPSPWLCCSVAVILATKMILDYLRGRPK